MDKFDRNLNALLFVAGVALMPYALGVAFLIDAVSRLIGVR